MEKSDLADLKKLLKDEGYSQKASEEIAKFYK
jgi:hypothetical protein